MVTTKELIKGIKACENIFRKWIEEEGLDIVGEVLVHVSNDNKRAVYFATVNKNVPLQLLYFNCKGYMSLDGKNNRLKDFEIEFCSDGSREAEDLLEKYCKHLKIYMNI